MGKLSVIWYASLSRAQRKDHQLAFLSLCVFNDRTVFLQQYSKQLEETMEKFSQGEIKILTCTNIVESGLDIQNANTIIIQDVQQFGLAQLYQVLFFLLLLLPFYFYFYCLKNLSERRMCVKIIIHNCFLGCFVLFHKFKQSEYCGPRASQTHHPCSYHVIFSLCFPLNGNSFGEGWEGQIRKLMHTCFTQRSHF